MTDPIEALAHITLTSTGAWSLSAVASALSHQLVQIRGARASARDLG